MAVVDLLEAVQIDPQYRHSALGALGAAGGAGETIAAQTAIRQPGQAVVVGVIHQLRLHPAPLQNQRSHIAGRLQHLQIALGGIPLQQGVNGDGSQSAGVRGKEGHGPDGEQAIGPQELAPGAVLRTQIFDEIGLAGGQGHALRGSRVVRDDGVQVLPHLVAQPGAGGHLQHAGV